jgi:hypothetical protein
VNYKNGFKPNKLLICKKQKMISYIILAILFGLWYYFKNPSVPKGLKPLPTPDGARFYFGNFLFINYKFI